MKYITIGAALILVVGVGSTLYIRSHSSAMSHTEDSTEVTQTKATNEVSSDVAITIVMAQPKVKAWMALFTNKDGSSTTTGGFPHFAVVAQNMEYYTIKVYEDSKDEHTATFGFYDVYKSDGRVVSEIDN